MLHQLEDRRVVADGDYFVAPSAAVIGRVRLKNNVSVWFSFNTALSVQEEVDRP